MSHGLKSLDNSTGLAGVAVSPYASNIKGCDNAAGNFGPAETAQNPRECRTQVLLVNDAYVPIIDLIEDDCAREIDRRLGSALGLAGHSPLGMPGTVDTMKAMLARAGLALVLA